MASPILELEIARSAAEDSFALPEFALDPQAPSLGRYARTLRPLRFSQLLWLARRRLVPRFPLRGPSEPRGSIHLRRLTAHLAFPEWQPTVARQMLASGIFRFLNVEHDGPSVVPWSMPNLSRLWLYQINSCDFLNLNLTRTGDRALLHRALWLLRDWCARNANGREIGWDPYPTSLRIVNWLKFLVRHFARLPSVGNEGTASAILSSVWLQARALEGQLEFHLRGNHLLKNAKALLFAGALIESRDSARWRNKGLRLLESQLSEQILADGGHFERSPMYHALALEDLLDLEWLFAATERPRLRVHFALSEKIRAMASFLAKIVHPDGEIPLFGDSAFEIASPADELLKRAHLPNRIPCNQQSLTTVSPATGYAVLHDALSRSSLIFDCGPIGPREQPGHGHCNALGYELSLEGQRVVVDTGVSTYETGLERHYERSTAAHNTIRVDGCDQAEIWASFRVGRRPRVSPICSGTLDGIRFVAGSHDAYRRLGVMHGRQILHAPEGSWVVIDDLRGRGWHKIESFIHFHPAVHVEECSADDRPVPGGWKRRFLLRAAHSSYVLFSSAFGSFTLKEGWYAPEFGRREKQRVGYWTWEGELPIRLLYAFVPANAGLPRLPLSPASDWLVAGPTHICLS